MQGRGWATKEDNGEGGRRMGSLEKIRGKSIVLSTSFWPSKLPKTSPRASETDIKVFSLFGLCLFQWIITSQLVFYFSHIICHFEVI